MWPHSFTLSPSLDEKNDKLWCEYFHFLFASFFSLPNRESINSVSFFIRFPHSAWNFDMFILNGYSIYDTIVHLFRSWSPRNWKKRRKMKFFSSSIGIWLVKIAQNTKITFLTKFYTKLFSVLHNNWKAHSDKMGKHLSVIFDDTNTYGRVFFLSFFLF